MSTPFTGASMQARGSFGGGGSRERIGDCQCCYDGRKGCFEATCPALRANIRAGLVEEEGGTIFYKDGAKLTPQRGGMQQEVMRRLQADVQIDEEWEELKEPQVNVTIRAREMAEEVERMVLTMVSNGVEMSVAKNVAWALVHKEPKPKRREGFQGAQGREPVEEGSIFVIDQSLFEEEDENTYDPTEPVISSPIVTSPNISKQQSPIDMPFEFSPVNVACIEPTKLEYEVEVERVQEEWTSTLSASRSEKGCCQQSESMPKREGRRNAEGWDESDIHVIVHVAPEPLAGRHTKLQGEVDIGYAEYPSFIQVPPPPPYCEQESRAEAEIKEEDHAVRSPSLQMKGMSGTIALPGHYGLASYVKNRINAQRLRFYPSVHLSSKSRQHSGRKIQSFRYSVEAFFEAAQEARLPWRRSKILQAKNEPRGRGKNAAEAAKVAGNEEVEWEGSKHPDLLQRNHPRGDVEEAAKEEADAMSTNDKAQVLLASRRTGSTNTRRRLVRSHRREEYNRRDPIRCISKELRRWAVV